MLDNLYNKIYLFVLLIVDGRRGNTFSINKIKNSKPQPAILHLRLEIVRKAAFRVGWVWMERRFYGFKLIKNTRKIQNGFKLQ